LGAIAFSAVARADDSKKDQIHCCHYFTCGCAGTGGGGSTICVTGPCPKAGQCSCLSSSVVSACTQCFFI
jgi:hypothetical protein